MKRRSIIYCVLGALLGVALAVPILGAAPAENPPAAEIVGSVLLPCPGPPTQALAPTTKMPQVSSGVETVKPPIGIGGLAASPPQYLPTVFFDQPLSAANQNAYVDQNFADMPTYTTYIADDFSNAVPWRVGRIYVPGDFWNGGSTFMNASSLTFAIYADAGGVPAGYPNDGVTTPLWTITLAPYDHQVTYSTGVPGGYQSNTVLSLDTPVVIPPGTWWMIFAPNMTFSGGGQFGRQPSDTTNGAVAKLINPGGGFGLGTTWQDWTVLGVAQHDIAFRLEEPVCPVFDNGPLVTHPGGGAGGADASALQTALSMSTYGFGMQQTYGYRLADDYTVTNPAGMYVDKLVLFAYQTGSGTDSTINHVNLRIWNGVPGVGSVIWGDTVTNVLESMAFHNVYRVADYSLTASNRPIMACVVNVGTTLPPGTYWFDWQMGGNLSSGPYSPPVSILGQTSTGNAMQYTTGWANALDTGTGTPQGMPFIVLGDCCPAITVSPATIPSVVAGTPYSQTFSATGGTPPYTYYVTGLLPAGLALVGDTLSGTPTGTGAFNIEIWAVDANGCAGMQTYNFTVDYTNFYDDMGNAVMCVNKITGDYKWTILTGPYTGLTLAGTARVYNGGNMFWSQPGAPHYVYLYYDPNNHRAWGYIYDYSAYIYSYLNDTDTTNNPPLCIGGP